MRVDMDKFAATLVKQHKRTMNRIEIGLARAARRGKAHMVKKTPVDQGQLRNSWKAMGQLLRNDAPHAGIIELGARPHKVSLEGQEAIREWARRHITYTVSKPLKRGHQGPRQQVTKRHRRDDPVLDEIVWGIVKKIERYGQPPTHFVRNELKTLTQLAKSEVEFGLKRRSRAEWAARRVAIKRGLA